MKKSKTVLSKNAWNIAKNYTEDPPAAIKSSSLVMDSSSMDDSLMNEQLEDEVMGEVAEAAGSQKSKVFERNLTQMVDVLHLRLRALESAAKLRIDYCAEDLNPNSTKESRSVPKIMEEFEDQHVNPRILKEIKPGGGGGTAKDVNLVSTDGVFIDPVRLIIKTKQQTETSKKLEMKLEDLFSSSSLREMKGKKSKASNRVARSKKTEAKRYEAKKLQRMRLEKELTVNMESYVTRSVNDSDLDFHPPARRGEEQEEEVVWPISIKWPRQELRSHSMEHVEGEMSPELLLLYALERISMPAGEHMMQKVFKNMSVQLYFIYMFWLVKVKFFLNDKEEGSEEFLLQRLSGEYVKIVELLSKKAHGENNKDFVFQYLPFIISNAVYYAFYFLCPGSRHMYSKGFRKTILMQVVQVMHGVQLCPVSVRVAWARLFPEEEQDELTHSDGEENDLIPMKIPLTHIKREAEQESSGGPRKGPLLDDGEETESPLSTPGNDRDKGQALATSLSAPQLGTSPAVLTTSVGTRVVEPVSRLSLRPPPSKSKFIVPRQRRERSDVNDISPLMQQYLVLPTASGCKRAQTLARTVPVNWCVAGGSDTHRRRHIPKELHDELSSRSRALQKDCRRVTCTAHTRKLADSRSLDKMCTTIIGAGNGAVGRYSQDLVRKLKHCRGLGDMESGDDVTVQSLIKVEDDDLYNDNISTMDGLL